MPRPSLVTVGCYRKNKNICALSIEDHEQIPCTSQLGPVSTLSFHPWLFVTGYTAVAVAHDTLAHKNDYLAGTTRQGIKMSTCQTDRFCRGFPHVLIRSGLETVWSRLQRIQNICTHIKCTGRTRNGTEPSWREEDQQKAAR